MQGIITLQQRDFYKIKLKQEIDGTPGQAIGNGSLWTDVPIQNSRTKEETEPAQIEDIQMNPHISHS